MVVPTVDCSGGHAIHPRVGHPATYSSSSSSSSSSRREMKRNAVGIADSRNFSGDTLPENSGGVTNAQERETKLAHSIGTYPVVFANSRFHRRKRERERERERKGATKHESPSRCALCPFSVRTTLSPPTPATPPADILIPDKEQTFTRCRWFAPILSLSPIRGIFYRHRPRRRRKRRKRMARPSSTLSPYRPKTD